MHDSNDSSMSNSTRIFDPSACSRIDDISIALRTKGYQLSGAVSYLYKHHRPFVEFDHTFSDNGTVFTRH